MKYDLVQFISYKAQLIFLFNPSISVQKCRSITSRKSSKVTDLLFLEAISSRSFLMSLRHFSISTTFIPSTEETEEMMVLHI